MRSDDMITRQWKIGKFKLRELRISDWSDKFFTFFFLSMTSHLDQPLDTSKYDSTNCSQRNFDSTIPF